VLRVVERPLECWEVLQQHSSQPVDGSHAIVDDIQAMRGQQAKSYGDGIGWVDGLQVGAHARLVRDDARVLGVRLAVPSVRCCSVMHDPPRQVQNLLTVCVEQRDEQRCSSIGKVRRPLDDPISGDDEDVGDDLQRSVSSFATFLDNNTVPSPSMRTKWCVRLPASIPAHSCAMAHLPSGMGVP